MQTLTLAILSQRSRTLEPRNGISAKAFSLVAGGGYKDGGSAIAEINVTPLVDVVLVLLVIFMVTAPMIAAQGIMVDSPEATTGEPVQSTLNLSITKDGTLAVQSDGEETTFTPDNRGEAAAVLGQFHEKNPEIRAVIAGDRGVPHGDVIEVIDMVRAAGIEKFALRTKSKVTLVEDESANDQTGPIPAPAP